MAGPAGPVVFTSTTIVCCFWPSWEWNKILKNCPEFIRCMFLSATKIHGKQIIEQFFYLVQNNHIPRGVNKFLLKPAGFFVNVFCLEPQPVNQTSPGTTRRSAPCSTATFKRGRQLRSFKVPLTRITLHNLPPRSAIFPPKLNHGACLSGFHSSSLPAFVDLSRPPPPCPPSRSHVSVEARQLLLIMLTQARGRCSASVMKVAYELWVHPPLRNLPDKMRQIELFTHSVVL